MVNSFIDVNCNDKFSAFNDLELQELLVEVNNFNFNYRNSLNLPDDVTFGVELEYENVSKDLVDEYITNNFKNWCSDFDKSLSSGGEIISPKMNDDISCWNELKEICNYLKINKANTNKNAGGHIHVGAHILGKNVKDWELFIKLYTLYEKVFFRFATGDKDKLRKKVFYHAPSNARFLYDNISAIEMVNNIYSLCSVLIFSLYDSALNFEHVKFFKINDSEVKNTIEFRSFNASVEETVVQNNINAVTKLMLAPSKGLVDEEFLNYKLKHDYIPVVDNSLFVGVNLKESLEFVDLVFDNNLDKMYFLKQYIKDFKVKSKRFFSVK